MNLFKNFSWRKFWHNDGLGAIAGGIGAAASPGGWGAVLVGAILGAIGGSAGYAILGD